MSASQSPSHDISGSISSPTTNISVVRVNGVSQYHLSGGRSSSYWSSQQFGTSNDSSLKKLKLNDSYRRRLEILQDFEFPISCQKLLLSSDGQSCLASGVYKPSVKCFEFEDLSLKWERKSDNEILSLCLLGNSHQKFVSLRVDRTLEFHSQFGFHQKIKIPKFGRNLEFVKETAQLFISTQGNHILNCNLEEGKFTKSLMATDSPSPSFDPLSFGVNVIKSLSSHSSDSYSPLSSFCLLSGNSNGILDIFDLRCPPSSSSSSSIIHFNVNSLPHGHGHDDGESSPISIPITSLNVNSSGMLLSVGSSSGETRIFDVRSRPPLHHFSHRNSFPIVHSEFIDNQSESAALIASADHKSIKLWNVMDGSPFTTITSEHKINDFKRIPSSGMIFIANENPRVDIYYLPSVGTAPKWASYIDTITEEMAEAEENHKQFEEFHFVRRDEITSLGLSHLVGTPTLRPYLNGFFLHTKLYQKFHALKFNSQDNFDEMMEKQIQNKMKKRREDAIINTKRNDIPNVSKVNSHLSLRENISSDSRFSSLFSDSQFQIDTKSKLFDKNFSKFNKNSHGEMDEKGNGNGNEEGEGEGDGDVAVSPSPSLSISHKSKMKLSVPFPPSFSHSAPQFFESKSLEIQRENKGNGKGKPMDMKHRHHDADDDDDTNYGNIPLSKRLKMFESNKSHSSASASKSHNSHAKRESLSSSSFSSRSLSSSSSRIPFHSPSSSNRRPFVRPGRK